MPKAATPKSAKPRAAAKSDGGETAAPDPAAADGTPPAGELRLKTLVDRAAAATGLARKEVRAVVDAALAEIGAALDRGEALSLPPLGKAKLARRTEKSGREVMVLKLKRSAAGAPDERLAKDGA